MDVSIDCPICGDRRTITVDTQAYLNWRGGELIQNAMPDLSPNDREALQTGICAPCWDKSFGEE